MPPCEIHRDSTIDIIVPNAFHGQYEWRRDKMSNRQSQKMLDPWKRLRNMPWNQTRKKRERDRLGLKEILPSCAARTVVDVDGFRSCCVDVFLSIFDTFRSLYLV